VTTATLYLRISLDRNLTEQGVDRQEEDCRKLCERMGWDVGQVFKDNSVSALRAKVRPAFEALVASKPELIVMWSVDRLVKKGVDLDKLIALDVPVHSVMAGPMDLATASGRLNARLLTSVAQFEGEIKSERHKAQHAQRARQGGKWWTRRPFGYDMDGTVREDEAEVLRQVYIDLLTGKSLYALSRELTERGVLPTQGAKLWRPTALRTLVLAPRNAGIITYHGEEVGKGQWPAIVPEETFRAVQRQLTNPSRRTAGSSAGKRKHLLSGVLKCAKCYGSATANNRGPHARSKYKYSYYVCRDNHCFSLRTDQVDNVVMGACIELLDSPEGRAIWRMREPDVDVEELRAELARMDEFLRGLMRQWMGGGIAEHEYLEGSAMARERKVEIEDQLAMSGLARAVGDAHMTADEVLARWNDKDFGIEKRRFVVDHMLGPIMAHSPGRGARSFNPAKVVEFGREELPLALRLVRGAEAS
jgi:DNA invertase Pin-like site-specific DNA recombinase